MAKLEQLRGIKVAKAKKGKGSKTRLQITPPIMWMLKGAWLSRNSMDAYDAAMLWASCSLCFFGVFWSGELTSPSESNYDPSENLCFQDIIFNNREKPSVLRVHLKTLKTDPFHVGVNVFVGKTGNDLCSVMAMVHYLSMRGGTAPCSSIGMENSSWERI